MLCVQGLGPHKLIRELVEIPVRLHGTPRLLGFKDRLYMN